MASTKDRILSVISKQPQDEHGWVDYNLDHLTNEISDKGRGNINTQFLSLVQSGHLEAERDGRFIKRVRLSQTNTVEDIKNGNKSQTERMLHYLFGLADEKGVIRGDVLDIRHLQKSLGFRDYHDTNKALHNLNKLGILEIRESRIGTGEKHRITKMRLRMERQRSWPIDLLTDDELPGNTDIEYEEEVEQPAVPVDPAPEEEWVEPIEEPDGLKERTEVVGLGSTEMDIMSEKTGDLEAVSEELKDDIGREYGASIDTEQAALVAPIAESASNTVEDFGQSFPLIFERVDIYRKRIRAREALSEAGETELADLLAEKLSDPLDRELMRLMIAAGYYG